MLDDASQTTLCRTCPPHTADSSDSAYVKPDIVFFGEQLPERFYQRMVSSAFVSRTHTPQRSSSTTTTPPPRPWQLRQQIDAHTVSTVTVRACSRVSHVAPTTRGMLSQERDFPACDLLLVMGTSLVVHPFASLVGACVSVASCLPWRTWCCCVATSTPHVWGVLDAYAPMPCIDSMHPPPTTHTRARASLWQTPCLTTAHACSSTASTWARQQAARAAAG
jgi:hypothetical protein